MNALQEMNRQADLVRTRVRGAASGYANGLLLYGPPGIGKSHLVEETLRFHGFKWVDAPKGLTPQGLLEFFKEHGSRIMLFDDVAELFRSERGRKYMMAACGSRPDCVQPRTVTYAKQGEQVHVVVSGCCLILTNDDNCPKAFASRIPVLKYVLVHEQVVALMRHIIRNGVRRDKWWLTSDECGVVLDCLVAEAVRLGVSLDLRDLLEKALPDYAMWKAGLSSLFWKEMVRAHLQEKTG